MSAQGTYRFYSVKRQTILLVNEELLGRERVKEHSIHYQSSKQLARPGQKEELYSVILKCIDDTMHLDRFLRFVQGASQPLAFLADDSQLLDLE